MFLTSVGCILSSAQHGQYSIVKTAAGVPSPAANSKPPFQPQAPRDKGVHLPPAAREGDS